MKIALVPLALSFLGGTSLVTRYATDQQWRTSVDGSIATQTTMSVEVDGQTQDTGGMAPQTESTWRIVQLDKVLESADGKPSKLRRSFEKVTGTNTTMAGGEENTTDLESPFQDLVLELTQGKDGVEVEVVEGSKPEDDEALKGHRLEFALDALLPESAVDKDASWELDSEHVKRALGLDLRPVLFPRPKAPEGEGARGGNRRGGRGGGGDRVLSIAEWKGEAKLVSLEEEADGLKCAKIELTLEASGDLPEQPMGGGRQRRDQLLESFDPFYSELVAGTYEIKLEGTLLFALEQHRPLSLELSGKASTVTDREMTRQERTMKFHSESEGEVSIKVSIEEHKDEKEDKQ